MSKAPLSLCYHAGCSNRVPKGYCEQHKPKRLRPDLDKLYKSRRWRETSERYRRSNPLCVICKEQGLYVSAYCVDHIKSVVNGGDFWDESNYQSLCRSCHNRKTRSELNARI